MIKRLFLVSFVAGTIAALALIALANHYAYLSVREDLERERSARLLISLSLWRYGTVGSTDVGAGTMTMQLDDVLGRQSRSIIVKIGGDTIIARQEGLKEGNVYVGLAEPSVARLSDIVPGERIAILIENRPDEQAFVARAILIGSPL